MPPRAHLTPSEKARVAALEAAHDAWLDLAAIVERHAEERSIAWQERHIPERFQDVMPWQLPRRLWNRYHRQEIKYAERLERAAQHASNAESCATQMRQIRNAALERRPKQQTLF